MCMRSANVPQRCPDSGAPFVIAYKQALLRDPLASLSPAIGSAKTIKLSHMEESSPLAALTARAHNRICSRDHHTTVGNPCMFSHLFFEAAGSRKFPVTLDSLWIASRINRFAMSSSGICALNFCICCR